MSGPDAVAGVLWTGVTAYAVFGGADFGAGFWSLLAGRGERDTRARSLIDWAIGPVWEANHVWLIFVLVVLWTGFSTAFEAIAANAVGNAVHSTTSTKISQTWFASQTGPIEWSTSARGRAPRSAPPAVRSQNPVPKSAPPNRA